MYARPRIVLRRSEAHSEVSDVAAFFHADGYIAREKIWDWTRRQVTAIAPKASGGARGSKAKAGAKKHR